MYWQAIQSKTASLRAAKDHQLDADELQNHVSITTGVPSFTISNNSITSSLRILTQP
jgi:hypothetical protein